MNPDQAPDLDAWLRRAFEGPVPDDGFAARVARSLPPRQRRRPWAVPAGALVGVALTAWALASTPWAAQVAREWAAADPGAASAALLALLAAMAWLGCAWALEEGA